MTVAMNAAATLMDEANTDLLAGGAAFPFTVAPGYTGFTTPATFARFNRALAAKTDSPAERKSMLACDPW